jgi:hypothetical protein
MNAGESVYRRTAVDPAQAAGVLASWALGPQHLNVSQASSTDIRLKAPRGSHPNSVLALTAGQAWRVDDAIVQIVEVGSRLVYYKHLRGTDQKAAVTRMIKIEALAAYLRTNDAILAG